MKTVFSIGTVQAESDTLLLELGPGLCCYGVLRRPAKAFDAIRYISFDDLEDESSLPAIFGEWSSQQFGHVLVSSTWPQALLCPQSFAGSGEALVKAVYDLPAQQYLTDAVPEWQMGIAYALPRKVYELVTEKFPAARFVHAYTPTLKIYNGFVAPGQADICFSIRHFRVVVKKDGVVQLAQTYAYKTPLDVVYYLLKIFSEFGLHQSEAFVILSGLIEQDSALYEELHQYFLNLHFAQAPGYALPGDTHPHYFFTSLYNLAACVS